MQPRGLCRFFSGGLEPWGPLYLVRFPVFAFVGWLRRLGLDIATVLGLVGGVPLSRCFPNQSLGDCARTVRH